MYDYIIGARRCKKPLAAKGEVGFALKFEDYKAEGAKRMVERSTGIFMLLDLA